MQTRRHFLLRTAPLVVPGAVLGLNGAAPPSDRVVVGMIGMGRQTMAVNIKQFFAMKDVQVAAICDVDAWRLDNAKQIVEKQNGKGCLAYKDFREMLANKSIDAVMIATPDHWHVPMSMEAVKAGKDVSCEKPLTRSIGEGRALANLVKKHKRIFRTDSEFRSMPKYNQTVELVRNGRIGKLRSIVTGVPKGDVGCPPQLEMPVPPELDYERWQGPAPRAPYTLNRVHTPHSFARPGWMRNLYYCDGMVTNWGTHLNDLAQWGNNTDETGPIEVEGKGSYPPPESFWNVLLDLEVQYKYANGVRLTYKIDAPYIKFEGDDGWVRSDGAKVEASSPSIMAPPSGSNWVSLNKKTDKSDFIDAVKSRGRTLEDAEVGHRTTSVCHLAHIAIQLGKKLEWDPAKERFKNNKEADAYIDKPIHAPRRA